MIFRVSAIILVLLSAGPALADEPTRESSPVIDLAVSFDLNARLIRGTTKVQVGRNEALSLYLPGLTVTGAVLSTPQRENRIIDSSAASLVLAPADEPQTLLLSYEKIIDDSFANLLSVEAIVLTSGWHPIPDRKAKFSLTAAVPDGFTALAQSDRFDGRPVRSGSAHFSFSQPLHALTFIAAPFVVNERRVRDGLKVYTLFLKTERDLAQGYLDAAADYLHRYEALIGEFPYNHYVIAENIMPTGYGFPTFTLLGRQVIRLPFIKQTSLGHEILHSWFGNSVDIADNSGNWCEGLTTYLADMAYREEAGEGAAARKEAIITYLNYVDGTAATLASFRGAAHEQEADRAIRAVGYQKSAMLFHELEQRIGTDAFERGLRELYGQFRGTSASWQDLRKIFENQSGIDLQRFFSERLNSNQVPELNIDQATVAYRSGTPRLLLTVSQAQEQPYEVMLPIFTETIAGSEEHRELINRKQQTVDIALDNTPLAVVLDPGYDILRTLSTGERRPVWSSLLGTDTLMITPSDSAGTERYGPLLKLAERFGWKTRTQEELTRREIEQDTLLFLGDSPRLREMFGSPGHPEEGLVLDIRVNPFNQDEAIGLISSSSLQETSAAVSRLPHYGKYSYLHFRNGAVVDKRMSAAADGIRFELEPRPAGIALGEIPPLPSLLDQVSGNRVIYVGETHTSRPDHLLQLMLIEALHQRGKKLAIGMEMFPRTSQPALDRWIDKRDLSEAEFVQQSGYFSVWGYDYRLFRPIFDFARRQRIPLVALNIDRDIVSSVFKNGSLDGLSDEQRQSLPSEMRLDMAGYIERLRATHRMHLQGGQASGSFSGFIQSQALWDEAMAESIAGYLREHPDTTMVVLAGSQHTRKDSGIPPRVARRIRVDQASVLNAATNPDSPQELSAIADYLFFFAASEFPPQGKIGIILEETGDEQDPRLRISGLSPESNAEAAGLRVDDLLIFIDEFTIHSMTDVKLALLDRKAGDTVTITISRKAGRDRKEISLPVELYYPPPMAGHP